VGHHNAARIDDGAGEGEEGADKWGPHVGGRRERRQRGQVAQPKGENVFLLGRQWHAGQLGQLGEAVACGEGWVGS
jgi:hypothetical protein